MSLCVVNRKQWNSQLRLYKSGLLIVQFLSFFKLDDFVIPLDPRWNMQALDIIRNSVDFDPQADQFQQLFALLESVANK